MIRRLAAASVAAVVSAITLRRFARRASDRLLAAPRTSSDEASLGPRIDALGGEVVRFRSRDGLRLAARWLPAEASGDWRADPHEAILLLHGWSGSSAPDVVQYGPFLRRTAGVLGLDFRGHGGSDACALDARAARGGRRRRGARLAGRTRDRSGRPHGTVAGRCDRDRGRRGPRRRVAAERGCRPRDPGWRGPAASTEDRRRGGRFGRPGPRHADRVAASRPW